MRIRKIKKYGHALAIMINKADRMDLDIKEGDEIDINILSEHLQRKNRSKKNVKRS